MRLYGMWYVDKLPVHLVKIRCFYDDWKFSFQFVFSDGIKIITSPMIGR
jgi:hypothetical protein